MSRKKEEQERKEREAEEIRRVKLPKGREVIGVLDQRLGGSRMRVRCLDGKTRVCRVPGRFRRKMWLREGDIVLVEPWEFEGDTRGDIIFKYKGVQVDWLQKKGYLKKIEDFEEF